MRLIDADELKKRAVKVCFPNAPECGEFDAVVIYEIDIMPTIDPESLRPTAHISGLRAARKKSKPLQALPRCYKT